MKRFFYTEMWQVSCLGLALALGSCVPAEELNVFPSNGLEMGCAVGDVSSHEAVVWVKTEGSQEVKILYTTDPLWTAPKGTLLISANADRDFTAHIPLVDLTPHTRYLYRAFIPGKKQGPICEFVTAPLPNDPVPVTFVIGGDTRHSFQPFSIMDFMRSARPDFFVYLGDTIYSDRDNAAITLPDYWLKYKENRDGFAQRLFARTPLFVMWDDHEVENDFTMTHHRLPIGRPPVSRSTD